MSYWELRQTFEQAIPWWGPFVVPGVALFVWFLLKRSKP